MHANQQSAANTTAVTFAVIYRFRLIHYYY